jgi:ribosome-associated translation inhibitor RaiA
MIELGGNITLHGFKDRDYAELIVVKKIVGRYARQISDQHQGMEALSVTLKAEKSGYTVEASCKAKGVEVHSADTQPNLFVALDGALKKVVQQLG